jgi:uncharacterized membrane protein YdjX (TVP38/TMEM64 family)
MSPRTRKRLTLLIGVAFLVGAAIWVRRTLGLDFDPQSLRELVLGVGPTAPVVLVGLVTFRSLLGIPSQLVLVVAGLCFGTALGALYGTIGLTLSGLGAFLVARHAGRDAIESRIPDRLRPFIEQASERPGAVFIAMGTGYPVGFITAYHALAGVTAMRVGIFALALAIGSAARAATYTYFGSSLVAGGMRPILEATALIGVVLVLPLLFSRSREWLFKVVLARD